jgi:hypothetical protein
VTGVVLLAVGLSLLRLAGRAPLWQQVRAMHHWDGARWISVGVFTIGFLAGLALQFFNPLLALPRWLYYGLSIAISLICIAGISLWPRDRSSLRRARIFRATLGRMRPECSRVFGRCGQSAWPQYLRSRPKFIRR